MNRKLLQIIILLLISGGIFAQPQILQQTRQRWDPEVEEWINDERYEYDYDDGGNTILTFLQSWDPEDDRWKAQSKQSALFNSSGQQTFFSWQQWDLTADTVRSHQQTIYLLDHSGHVEEILGQRWDFADHRWQDYYQILELHDENGCLIEKTNLQGDAGGNLQNKIKTYYSRDEDCSTYEILEQNWSSSANGWRDVNLTEYYYSPSGDSIVRTFSRHHPDSNRFVVTGQAQTLFDDQGRWVGSWTNTNQANDEERRSRAYTTDGQIKYNAYEVLYGHLLDWTTVELEEIEYTSEGSLYQKTISRNWARWLDNWESIQITRYFYDKQGFLIREHFIQYLNTSGQAIEGEVLYTNYCDGLVKTAQRNKLTGTGTIPDHRTHFIYTEGAPCEAASGEDPLVLFPNPTSGLISIQHPMLLRGNTSIEIMDAAGRLVLSPFISYRTELYKMDLFDLPNGTYYLRATNGELSVGTKVLIVK